ncbi:diguanylate cyclase [Catellatospora bangladeshensis]|uniref:diguanylate cyclase n=1 Tax=Catellatospora bangladeshensis TaxID=310355 RepID=UPI0036069340
MQADTSDRPRRPEMALRHRARARWLAASWPNPARLLTPLARVGPRLTVAFLSVALLLPLIGLVAVNEQYRASLHAAQIEAENVAEQVAHTVAQPAEPGRPVLYQQPAQLQRYVSGVQRDDGRDLEIVGLDRRILADALPDDQGRLFTLDGGGEVAATMRDGKPRSFLEISPDFPDGIEVMAVPLRTAHDSIVGAVLLEYTPLHRELLAAGGVTRQVIVAASLTGMAAALMLGYLLSRDLVRDLRGLTRTAHLLAAGDDAARAWVGSRGELGELAAAFNDMARRIAAQKATLTEQAVRDPLTGLHNRRAFTQRLDETLARSRRSGAPMALLMLDLDHFKDVNDRYGHPAGDQALRTVAALLARELRAVDVAARLGGEEFGVLLPGSDQDEAVLVAERLRLAIARCPIVCASVTLTVTTSIGVVSYPRHARTADELSRLADEALYLAKRGGRDRVCGPSGPDQGRSGQR